MGNSLTIQSNNFTLSKVNFTSVYQKRLVYSIIDSISPYLRKELNSDSFESSYEKGLFDIDRITYRKQDLEPLTSNYKHLRKAIEELTTKSITIETEDSIIGTSFVLRYEWKKGSEFIQLSIDRQLYEFLFDLSKGYALLEMKTALSLPSVYSMKIYELLAKWRKRPKFYISIEELRFITNTEKKYPNFFDFNKRVLSPAKNHLDESNITDLRFNYEVKKQGRSIVGVWIYVIKTNNSIEVRKETEQVSPRWVLSHKVIEELKAIGIDINNTITEITLKFSSIYNHDDDKIIEKLQYFEEKGEQAVGLNKMPSYVVKSMKNAIEKK